MDILGTLYGWFQEVWLLGINIEIFGVSLMSILIALTIFSIVIPSLLNFAKTTTENSISGTMDIGVSRYKSYRKALTEIHNNPHGALGWMFD